MNVSRNELIKALECSVSLKPPVRCFRCKYKREEGCDMDQMNRDAAEMLRNGPESEWIQIIRMDGEISRRFVRCGSCDTKARRDLIGEFCKKCGCSMENTKEMKT